MTPRHGTSTSKCAIIQESTPSWRNWFVAVGINTSSLSMCSWRPSIVYYCLGLLDTNSSHKCHRQFIRFDHSAPCVKISALPSIRQTPASRKYHSEDCLRAANGQTNCQFIQYHLELETASEHQPGAGPALRDALFTVRDSNSQNRRKKLLQLRTQM
jgi:hypothetical protein